MICQCLSSYSYCQKDRVGHQYILLSYKATTWGGALYETTKSEAPCYMINKKKPKAPCSTLKVLLQCEQPEKIIGNDDVFV